MMKKLKSAARMMILVAMMATLVSCGSDDNAPESPPANNTTADAGADATDNSNNTDSDAEIEPAESEFEIGTNPAYENSPESFTPMADGEEVPLTYGVQGSWMVVVGFRSRNLLDGQFDIRADITIDGVESGDIWYEFQDTFRGSDGWNYYLGLFLAIDQDDPPARGTPATIHVSVEDQNGNFAEETHDVLIGEASGGP